MGDGLSTGAKSLLLAWLFAGLAAGGLSAQDDPTESKPEHLPGDAIQQVLEHRDFGYEYTVDEWQRKDSDNVSPGQLTELSGIGQVMRIVYWGVAIALAVFLVILLFAAMNSAGEARRLRERGPPPVEVMGLDVRPESLPDDPGAAAWRLWQAGDAVACLSLLYRASLARLIHDRDLHIRPSATETDCVTLVAGVGVADLLSYFRGLTEVWQTCAYAHRVPSHEIAERLCKQWPLRFGGES